MTAQLQTAGADGACHVLQLPGELRKMVYRFALFSPDGIRYHSDSNRVGRLNDRTEETAKPITTECEVNQLQRVCREHRYN